LYLWLCWVALVAPAAVWVYVQLERRTYDAPTELHLTDWDGHARLLVDFRGKVVMVYFGYTRCPEACPLELYGLSRLMRHLGASRARVQVLFITLDPERDTPKYLKLYLNSFDPTFLALTGSMAEVDRAARSFGVTYVRVPIGNDYSIDHTSVTYLLDTQGHLRFREPSSAYLDDYLRDLSKLLKNGSS
jgi:protein SCO1/2